APAAARTCCRAETRPPSSARSKGSWRSIRVVAVFGPHGSRRWVEQRNADSSYGPWCRIATPTANTSLLELPQTPARPDVVPLVWELQPPPSLCRIVPDVPTANTSLAELPHTPRRRHIPPLVCVLQPLPL